MRALEIALGALRRGEVDMAIVGAVDLLPVDPVTWRRRIRFFEEPGHPADAACALLLKRREDAERDGDAILACFDHEAEAARAIGRPMRRAIAKISAAPMRRTELFALCGAILSIRDGILPP